MAAIGRRKKKEPLNEALFVPPFAVGLSLPVGLADLMGRTLRQDSHSVNRGFCGKFMFLCATKKPRLQGVHGAASPQGEHHDTDTFREGQNKSICATANEGGTNVLRMYCQIRVTTLMGKIIWIRPFSSVVWMDYATPQELILKYANRHGLIVNTGNGKTVTQNGRARFSRRAPAFLSDVKGDLSDWPKQVVLILNSMTRSAPARRKLVWILMAIVLFQSVSGYFWRKGPSDPGATVSEMGPVLWRVCWN